MATWKGGAQLVVAAPIEKVWFLASDFGGVDKWFPKEANATSRIIEGEPQVVGCVRSVVIPPDLTVNERLLELNHKEHTMRFKIEKNTLGLDGAIVTVRLSRRGDATLAELQSQITASGVRTEQEFKALVDGMCTDLLKGLEALVHASF